MKRVERANRNWRKAFVAHMNDLGFGLGSLVSVPKAIIDTWSDRTNTTGIIVRYDKQKLNMFCTLELTTSDYHSEPTVEILCEGKLVVSPVSRFVGNFDEQIIGNRFTWNHYSIHSISPSTSAVDDDFYELVDDKAFEWFENKISMKASEWERLEAVIKRW